MTLNDRNLPSYPIQLFQSAVEANEARPILSAEKIAPDL